MGLIRPGFEDKMYSLMNAVAYQAVKDYRKALVKYHNLREVKRLPCKDPNVQKAKSDVDILETFFKQGASAWTNLNGPKLMKMVKQDLIDNKYDLKNIHKRLVHRSNEDDVGV